MFFLTINCFFILKSIAWFISITELKTEVKSKLSKCMLQHRLCLDTKRSNTGCSFVEVLSFLKEWS